ncbi:hypothetical protein CRENBAI_003868 [Crenichthys baileyi]|uniref:Uncharacterized protein n=1 Tax=Crenichthys baileyi TaxID=28760 RepID=A0AAV9SQT6_9TELE
MADRVPRIHLVSLVFLMGHQVHVRATANTILWPIDLYWPCPSYTPGVPVFSLWATRCMGGPRPILSYGPIDLYWPCPSYTPGVPGFPLWGHQVHGRSATANTILWPIDLYWPCPSYTPGVPGFPLWAHQGLQVWARSDKALPSCGSVKCAERAKFPSSPFPAGTSDRHTGSTFSNALYDPPPPQNELCENQPDRPTLRKSVSPRESSEFTPGKVPDSWGHSLTLYWPCPSYTPGVLVFPYGPPGAWGATANTILWPIDLYWPCPSYTPGVPGFSLMGHQVHVSAQPANYYPMVPIGLVLAVSLVYTWCPWFSLMGHQVHGRATANTILWPIDLYWPCPSYAPGVPGFPLWATRCM